MKKRLLGLTFSATLLVGLFIVLPGMGANEEKDGRDGLYRPLGLFTEVLTLVQSHYVEPVEIKPLMAGAFSGIAEAMDPFSEYIPPDKTAAFLAAQTARAKPESLETGLVLARRFGYPVVVSAIAGSPAAGAGFKSGDVIEKVQDRPARALALWEVESMLAGPAGGRVRLAVVRDGKPRRRTLEIVRAGWTPETPSASRVEGQTLVKVPSFTPGTAARLKKILEPFDKTKALILDLRGNASGTFDEAARAAALFVAPGALGELKGRKIESTKYAAEPGERVHEGRLVLLVDAGTAGSAELFVSGLREAAGREVGGGRAPKVAQASPARETPSATAEAEAADDAAAPADAPRSRVRVVGEPTYGMGFVSQVVKLQSGGSLKISVGRLRTPSGRALSPKGFEPDDRVFTAAADDDQVPADLILQRGLKVLSEGKPSSASAS